MTKTSDLRGDEIIDSRDIIERLRDLTEAREDAKGETWTAADGTEFSADWDEEQEDEFQALKALEDDASGSGEWKYGETLIRGDYFETYAEQLAEEIGAIDPKGKWPLNHIDWETAAEELKWDYISLDFDGTEYWMRA